MLERLIMFINAFLSLREANDILFMAAHNGPGRIIMTSEDRSKLEDSHRSTEQYRHFANIDQKLIEGLREFLEEKGDQSLDTSKFHGLLVCMS
jgi:hypothetical protein